MPLSIQVSECSPSELQARKAHNDELEKVTNSRPHWYEASSVAEYRKWRADGSHGFPRPVYEPRAETIEIPSTHGKHSIPIRLIAPQSATKGVFLYFHGGGLAIGSASSQDPLLTKIADGLSLTVASVEYRMVPEHPFPAAGDDCFDACLFALSSDGPDKLGGTLRAMGGDSAGAFLTVRVALQLRDHGINVREKIAALVPSYGIFDLSYTPSVGIHSRRIIMGSGDTKRFIDLGFPPDKFPLEKRKLPEWSPIYADLHDLPPALFLVGTQDPLIDDSVFMANRWFLAGNTTELKIVQEGFHGFTIFPVGNMTEEGIGDIVGFVGRQLL